MPAPRSDIPAASGRMPGLDGLRGLAALAVVVLHVWMYTEANRPGRSAFVDAVAGELRVAVGLFFVLSGFLLVRPWVAAGRGERRAPDVARFFAKRIARIGPAYWVALAGAFLLFHGTGHGREGGVGTLPAFALFLENMFAATRGKLDPPMWSLGIEVSFYALLPVLGWALVRAARALGAVAGPLALCGGLVAVNAAWLWAGTRGGWPPETMWTLPTYVGLFASGMGAAVLVHGRAPGRGASAALLLGGWLAVVANGWWHSPGTGFVGHVVADLPAGIGFAAVVAAVATRPPGLLASAPLRALGAVSYGVYLWHMPVLFWLRMHHALPARAVAALALVLAPTLALGAASWWLVERPAVRAIGRDRDRRARPARPRSRVGAPAAELAD
jgi:peptidoglycan/LPS O-acetylase OafA/YrhL